MPQAIGAAVLAAVGVSATTAATAVIGTTTLASLVGSTILAGGLIGAQLIFAEKPKVPEQADTRVTIKQAIPPAIYGYGRARSGGAYAAFLLAGSNSHDVYTFHQGKINRFVQWYLQDDPVSFWSGSDGPVRPYRGRYSGNDTSRVEIYWRRGEATETAYPLMVERFPGKWTANHRGDGVASAHLICRTAGAKRQAKNFPFGLPKLSVVAEWALCWDPRDPSQSPADRSTWKWSNNPFVCLLDFYCFHPAGFRRPLAQVYAPTAGYWLAAMDRCDEIVARADGTTEKRYVCGGMFDAKTARDGVVGALLRSCDGWLAERGDGAIVVYAGAYYAPSVTIEDRHLYDIDVRRGRLADERVTQVDVKLSSPDHGYDTVPADPWVNQEEIDAGAPPVLREAQAEWVQSYTQARRLAKVEFSRARCALRGTLILRAFGENLRGRRYFMLNYTGRASTRMVPCEILDFHDNMFESGSYEVEFQSVDPARYDWDAATEEGRRPAIPPDTEDDETPVPPIPELALIRETIGGQTVVRISASSPPVEGYDDLTLTGWYRKVGETSWRAMTAPDDDLQVLSDPVGDGDYEAQTAYVGADGSESDRSPSAPITVVLDNVAPPTPVSPTAALSGGAVTAGARGAPTSVGAVDHTAALEARRGTPAQAAISASIVNVQTARANDTRSFVDTPGPGVHRYSWFALNGSGLRSSAAAGPIDVKVPGQVGSDNFNRANGALANGWTRVSGSATASISGNEVTFATGTSAVYVQADLFTPDHYAQAAVRFTVSSLSAIVAVRVQDPNNYVALRYYMGNWDLFKVVGGTSTLIAQAATALPAQGTVLRLTAVGDTISATVDGVAPSAAFTNASLGGSLPAVTRVGFLVRSALTPAFDDYVWGIA